MVSSYVQCTIPADLIDPGRPTTEVQPLYTHPETQKVCQAGPLFRAGVGDVVKCTNTAAHEALIALGDDGARWFTEIPDDPPPEVVHVDFDQFIADYVAQNGSDEAQQHRPGMSATGNDAGSRAVEDRC